MIYTSEDNWYKWQYGDDKLFGRHTEFEFKTFFSKSKTPIGSFEEELKKAAKSTMDYYPNMRPAIMLSGGVDSELVLRVYKDIGANPIAYIARYENDINIIDVSYAIAGAFSIGVPYKIINFNIHQFFINEAESVVEKAEVDFPRALPQLKFMNYVEDNELPIYCSSDPSWYRPHDNYKIKARWSSLCHEFDIGYSKWILLHNRPGIGEWFKWTPGLVLSYTRLNWFKKLINDEIYGKTGVNSSKIVGYKEVYPQLLTRPKLTGFETVGPLIIEFEQFIEKKYGTLPFRGKVRRYLEDIEREIIG